MMARLVLILIALVVSPWCVFHPPHGWFMFVIMWSTLIRAINKGDI